ncbi:hypothetical protein [Bacillus sp. EAC]|uniref:hypothetical protein n=1 Tax=Bacillus sp. EAC TaxID=1978338 RepID=UPI0015C50821|nr:hypothetical protein [Bacillus sp. EAC]
MIWIALGTIGFVVIVAVFNALVFGKSPTQELSDEQVQELERVRNSSFTSNGDGS